MDYSNLKDNFSKFQDLDFRPHQEAAIDFALQSTKPIVVIQAPTGFGKSLVGACIGSASRSFTYLVSTKHLQNQLNSDFPEIKLLKGRSNYTCNLTPSLNAAECVHSKVAPCSHKKSDCYYEEAKRNVLASKYRLLNYHYFITEANFIGRFSDQEVLICDEGDLLENLLANFISLQIPGVVVRDLKIEPPPYKTTSSHKSIPEFIKWINKISDKVYNSLRKTDTELESGPDEDRMKELTELKQRLETLNFQIGVFKNNADQNWIFEIREPKNKYFKPSYKFRPTWISENLSDQYFFKHAKKFIIISATFPPANILGKLIGRPAGDFDYYSAPSNFPVENRRVYSLGVGHVTQKKMDETLPHIRESIHDVLESYIYDKGIIHTVSYKLRDIIMSWGIPRLITHNSNDREETIEHFKNSEDNLVLISPSIERGVDLPQDECRFIIWVKCPFLYLGDKLVSARIYKSKIGNVWYKSAAAQTIIQGCGRGVRSSDDKCTTYLLDSQIQRLIVDHRNLFPGYFLEAVEIGW